MSARRARRGLLRRVGLAALVAAVIVVIAMSQLLAEPGGGDPATTDRASAAKRAGPSASTSRPSTSTRPPTTTTTRPPLAQPAPIALPPVPGRALEQGSAAFELGAYEQRLVDLHFDPGAVDGRFDRALRYSVEAVEKLLGWERDGVIDQAFVDALAVFRFPTPLVPDQDADRVEIDLDRQVLTVYENWQVALITTTSTGTGRRFCGGADGCQYAVTPPGRYRFGWHVDGWRDGDLGRLYNPWYFNGGIAVHGYESVPPSPASHGCARIPMHISEYFGDLVYEDMAVHVVGTPAARTGGPLSRGRDPGATTTPPAPPTTAPPPTSSVPPPSTAAPDTVAPVPASATRSTTTTPTDVTTVPVPASTPAP
jgi:hypothetical protein